jgi:hypothetical protein
MMRAARRASLLVAFSLLTSAPMAYAECAWVLWSQRYSPNPSAWVLQMAYPTIAACTQDLDQREKNAQKNAREAKPSADRRAPTDGFTLYTRDDTKLDIHDDTKGGTTWQCFPDTVDPRWPKGK